MRALLLDLDDTLFDRTAALRRWAERYGGVDVSDLDERGRRPRLAFAQDVVARLGLSDEPAALAARFPLELAACVQPEPGWRPILERIATRMRVAVVTNGGVAQRAKLRAAGLDDLVHEVFVSGELGVAKPDPAIWRHAAAWAGCDHGECLVVGDDPENDVEPAASLGMVTAWRVRGDYPAFRAPPRYVIRGTEDLAELLS